MSFRLIDKDGLTPLHSATCYLGSVLGDVRKSTQLPSWQEEDISHSHILYLSTAEWDSFSAISLLFEDSGFLVYGNHPGLETDVALGECMYALNLTSITPYELKCLYKGFKFRLAGERSKVSLFRFKRDGVYTLVHERTFNKGAI